MSSSDITKCAHGCKRQLLCRRWTASPHGLQSYAEFSQDTNAGTCEGYWPNAVALADTTHLINHNED